MKKKFTFLMAALMLLTIIGLPGKAVGQKEVTWERVTSISTLTYGGTFIMGYEATAKSGVIIPLRSKDCNATTSANGYFNTGTTNSSSTSGTIDMSDLSGVTTSDYEVYITASSTNGYINIQRTNSSGNYYGATSGGTTSNKGRLYTSGNSNETNLFPEWANQGDNQFKLTANVTGSYKYLKYNTGSPRFAFYNGAGEKIVFYKKNSGGGSSVTAPEITPSCAFETSQTVTITPADGTTAYYTTDGSTPSNTSTQYTAPFTVTSTTTVKTIAYNGNEASSVVSATYTKITNIEDITATGTYAVKGTVVAKNMKGLVLGDGTGYIFYYLNATPTYNINDNLIIAGAVSSAGYNGYDKVFQFTDSATVTTASTSSYSSETPAAATITEIPYLYNNNGLHLSDYYQFDGILTFNGYYYVEFGDYSRVLLANPINTSELSNLKNKPVRVKGYFVGVSSLYFFSVMYASIEEIDGSSLPVYQWLPADITSLKDSDIFVIVGKCSNKYYSMSNNGGTSNSPTATEKTIDATDGITTYVSHIEEWKIGGNSTDGYTFYPNNGSDNSSWLFVNTTASSSSNTCLRVGSGNTATGGARKLFVADGTTYKTKDSYTARYFNVYNGSDWRGYTSNSTSTEISFYKRVTPSSVATPTFTLAEGKYYSTQTTKIKCETTGAAIYYTLDGSTPSSSSTSYVADSDIEIASTTTIKAIAIKDNESSAEASATYTIEAPFTDMQDIFDAATTTATTHHIVFNDWIVSGVGTNGKRAYVTDGTKGFIIYNSEANSLTFQKGDVLTGEKECQLQLINGAANVLGLNRSDFTITQTGQTPTTTTTTIADLSAVNTGAVVNLGVLTWNGTIFVDGSSNEISNYTDWYSASLTANSTYNVKGVFVYYDGDKEIAPRDASDVTLYVPNTHTIMFSVNGVIDDGLKRSVIETYQLGALPTASDITVPSGFTLAGWMESPDVPYYSATTPPTMVSSSTVPIDDMILEAVFCVSIPGESHWTLTNQAPSGGDEVMLAAKNDDNYYAMFASTSSLTTSSSFTITNGVIADGDVPSGFVWYVESAGGNNVYLFSGLYNNDDKKLYLHLNSSSYKIAATTTNGTFTFTTSGTGFKAQAGDSNTRYITFTSNSFNGTSSSGDACTLYVFKSIAEQGEIYNYTTLVQDEDISSSTTGVTRIFGEIAATAGFTNNGTITIYDGGVLNMGNNKLTNTDATKLIIEDGGQLILKDGDDDVAATVKKNITAPTAWNQNDKTGWYAISSTVGTISDITSVSNFANQTFDLYKYVESSNVGYGWINYAAHTEDFGGLVNGLGYLYARQNGATVSFTGNVNHTDVELTGLTANNSANENLRGIHLIGNPYTHNIYKGVALTATKGAMSSTYYRLDGNNLWVVESDDNPIGPGQGFLVKVTDGTDLTFTNNASAPGSSKANNDYIRFAVSNSEYEDATFALFQKGEGLRKINHRNTEAPMIYISQNDANYASATMDDDTKSFNLNFEAKTMGQYKLSYKVNGEFNYLHVIDRTTGEDIDMLLEGSYSFIGSPMDNANRFIVRLGYLPNYDDNGKDIFAYQNGNDIVVSGEGELQIFDVMGRKVSTMNIYGIETVNGLAQGVYIFRLEGKTQKIVVR